jgi:ribosomal protein S18 acetylase RimI-like enzyme
VSRRPATDDDLPFLLRVYASTREEELRAVPWTPDQTEEFLRSQFELQHREYHRNHPDASFEVLLVDGAEAGRLYVRRTDDEVHVLDIALLPEFRDRGIGTALLHELMDEAAGAGRVASIYVEQTNRALSLYRRLGFEPVADQGIYMLMEWRPPGADVS